MHDVVWLRVAVGTAIVIALAHSYLGERSVIGPILRREDLPRLRGSRQFTRAVLRNAWHLTSVAWVGLASVLPLVSQADAASRGAVGAAVAAAFGVSGLVVLVTTRGRHVAWPFFCMAAAASWAGTH